jgi:hypothetical protein
MLQVTTPDLRTWDTLLPEPARRLPDELAKVDAFLDDERFIAPWRARFRRGSTPGWAARRSRSRPWSACSTSSTATSWATRRWSGR